MFSLKISNVSCSLTTVSQTGLAVCCSLHVSCFVFLLFFTFHTIVDELQCNQLAT